MDALRRAVERGEVPVPPMRTVPPPPPLRTRRRAMVEAAVLISVELTACASLVGLLIWRAW